MDILRQYCNMWVACASVTRAQHEQKRKLALWVLAVVLISHCGHLFVRHALDYDGVRRALAHETLPTGNPLNLQKQLHLAGLAPSYRTHFLIVNPTAGSIELEDLRRVCLGL